MFKSVKRDKHVCKLVRFPTELAPVRHFRDLSFVTGYLKSLCADVDPDHPPSSSLRHFNRVSAFAATKIDDRLSVDCLKKSLAQEHF